MAGYIPLIFEQFHVSQRSTLANCVFYKIYGRTSGIGMLFYHSVDTNVRIESTLAYYPICDESGYPIYVYWFKIERFEDTFEL